MQYKFFCLSVTKFVCVSLSIYQSVCECVSVTNFSQYLKNYCRYSDATFCIRYNFATSRLYQNFKSIGPTVLPTEQLKVGNRKNGFSKLKNFLYSLQMLPNLALIS
ncbi:hypothetical protein O3M35_008341 [Rhynocoris fuscipes]|uniref:Uncharacterized protein n=1 Tax=Rhynocoris fuscipes TaxID=488301 RepID=A0AAW1D888_9HEMI